MKTTNVVLKIVSVLAAAAVCTGSINAADHTASVTGSANVGFSNENYYRGADIGDNTLSAKVALGTKVGNLELTGSFQADQAIGTGSDQHYISAGVASSLFDDVLSVDFGVLHTETHPGDSRIELYLGGELNTVLSPSITLYRDLDDALWTTELGVSHTLDLDVVKLTGSVGWGNTDTTTSTDRDYLTLGACLCKDVTDNIDLYVSVEYIDPNDADDETFYSTGVAFKF